MWLPATALILSFACAGGPPCESWGPGDSDVVISEVNYHPPEDEDAEEFLELHNFGVHWVGVGGWMFTQGIEFTLPEGTFIGPGEYLVVAKDREALASRRKESGLAPSSIVGNYKGNLKNEGEILELKSRTGRVIATLHYRDGHGAEGGLWPERPDGRGPTLELIQAHPDWHRPWYWAPSLLPGGTPGRENSRWLPKPGSPLPGARSPGTSSLAKVARLVVNEARLDETGPFVEIFNEGTASGKLDGLRLTRDLHGAGGIAPSGSVAPRKFLVLEGETIAPLLVQPGRTLFLVDGDTGEMLDSLKVKSKSPPQGSYGRFPDGSSGDMTLFKATKGTANAAPPAPTVVINEIHYNSFSGVKEDEFVEIHNKGRKAVLLEGWKLERAVTFEFEAGASLPAGGYAVVAGDPEKIRARCGPAEAGRVWGPFKGKLSNSGESLVLRNEWGNTVDRVRYHDRPPWPADADGRGFSLELIHPDLDNSWSQAWTLGGPEGTPCARNVRMAKNMAPAIDGVRHAPAVPGPDDQVTVHAQVLDTGSISQVAVVYRGLDPVSLPVKKVLSDTGRVEDGAPRDGHYAGRLPRIPAGTLVGFSILARDSSGRVARFPEGEEECLFRVEDRARGPQGLTGMPVYRILMPPERWTAFVGAPKRADTWFPCTFVASIEGPGVNERNGTAFYGSSIRYRGNSSRNPPDGRMSYRIRLGGGQLHDGRDRLILNAFSSLAQKAGGDVMRWAGIPSSNVTVVRLVMPAWEDHRYVDVEVVNNEFLDEKFGSSQGDLFRGRRGNPFGADLAYHGDDPKPYLAVYTRMNKKGDPAIPSLIRLLKALDVKDDEAYVKAVEELVDPQEWAMYFAANSICGNTEGGLSTGHADDFFLGQRAQDGRFFLVPWDQDSAFGFDVQSRQNAAVLPLYPTRLPATERFLRHSRFAPLYLRAVRELLDGPLSFGNVQRWARHLDGVFPPEDLARIEKFADEREAFLRRQFPLLPQAAVAAGESAGSSLGAGDRVFLASSAEDLQLFGFVDPAVAFGVRLGGEAVTYDPVAGRWSASRTGESFLPGPNLVWVEILGAGGDVAGLLPFNVERIAGFQKAPAEVTGSVVWTKDKGPWVLETRVVVRPGASLKIGPGVSVVCAPASSLSVSGRLLVEGAPREPVAFRPSEARKPWGGIHFAGTGTGQLSAEHLLSWCRFEGGRDEEPAPPGKGLPAAFVRVEGSKLRVENVVFRGMDGTALGSEGSELAVRGLRVADGRSALAARGGSLSLEAAEMCRLHRQGIDLSGVKGKISAAALRGALRQGISVAGGTIELEDVLIHASNIALSISGGARVRASRLTLVSCGIAISGARPGSSGSEASGSGGGGFLDLSSGVLWPSREPLAEVLGLDLELSDCLAGPPGGSWQASGVEGLRLEKPAFAAPEKQDFKLRESTARARGPVP